MQTQSADVMSTQAHNRSHCVDQAWRFRDVSGMYQNRTCKKKHAHGEMRKQKNERCKHELVKIVPITEFKTGVRAHETPRTFARRTRH